MDIPYFITGIGTDVGKTLVSAVLVEALGADYWKPIQAGTEGGTDVERVQSLVTNTKANFHPEAYLLQMPASPHIAAREEKVTIEMSKLLQAYQHIQEKLGKKKLLIEGAGGLLVPLSEQLLMVDLIKILQAKVILVSRNYLGSINHSLLTAAFCRLNEVDVAGWIFTDSYLNYEDEIVRWSGYKKIASIPKLKQVNKKTVAAEAKKIAAALEGLI